MNKKLGRFKQWAGEKVGGEKKTDTSEDFKALEAEMTLRHEGNIPLVGITSNLTEIVKAWKNSINQ